MNEVEEIFYSILECIVKFKNKNYRNLKIKK